VDYLIPKKLPYDFLKLIDIVSIERVKIDVLSGSVKLECYNNVIKYLKTNKGEIQFGWTFSQLGNIVLKLTAHVVVKLCDGTFKCVTPSEHNVAEIYFSPDDSIASLINNGRLPAKVYSLVDDKIVAKFVKLESLQSKMRLEGNLIAIEYIMNEKYLISERLVKSFHAYN
jgi:HTH-type transcriptional repressor of NAD biosynthesis genes